MKTRAGLWVGGAAFVEKNKASYVERLREAVAIRGVSAEPEKRPEVVKMVKKCQSWCEGLGAKTELKELGMQKHSPMRNVGTYATDFSKPFRKTTDPISAAAKARLAAYSKL